MPSGVQIPHVSWVFSVMVVTTDCLSVRKGSIPLKPVKVKMDKGTAELIYWCTVPKYDFLNVPEDLYGKCKKERVKIANRYSDLKLENSFEDANRMAIVEWLMNFA